MSIYLDHNATTPLRAEARTAMQPYLGPVFGNPSSAHGFGAEASAALDRSRRRILNFLGGPSGDLVFTGSGTEAVCLAVTGASRAKEPRGGHVIVAAIEHPSGLDAAAALEAGGWRVTRVRPRSDGRIHTGDVEHAFAADTTLVSVMHANNETGVIQPVEEIATLCRRFGVLYHVDAVQSAGKLPVAAERWGADLVSVASHKLGGPHGVGALWKRSGLDLRPLIPGSQERGFRGGTVNIAGVAGFAAATDAAERAMEAYTRSMRRLRDLLETGLRERVPATALTAAGSPRLPNTVHFTLSPELGPDWVVALDLAGFAVSAGTACRAGSEEASHVLLAMGVPPDRARTAVRVSLGRGNTDDDVVAFVAAMAGLVRSFAAGTESST